MNHPWVTSGTCLAPQRRYPPRAKGEDWARLGVNVDKDFEPLYVVPKERKAHVKKLKELLKDADELYLATDEDREGEAIAWHLVQVLKPKIPVKRMVFHEITKSAIAEAFASPRELDDRLVQAQEARRILDRLYGFEVSPVLWKKIQPKLSAGRVQSVAIRIVVERERERIAFTSAGYWSIEGTFAPQDGLDQRFSATPPLHRRVQDRFRKGLRQQWQIKRKGCCSRPGTGHYLGDRSHRLGLHSQLG